MHCLATKDRMSSTAWTAIFERRNHCADVHTCDIRNYNTIHIMAKYLFHNHYVLSHLTVYATVGNIQTKTLLNYVAMISESVAIYRFELLESFPIIDRNMF